MQNHHMICANCQVEAVQCPFSCLIKEIKINRLHAVSRAQQGKQRKSCVKALRSSLSAEFRRHCVLRDGTQRRALPRYQSEEMKI